MVERLREYMKYQNLLPSQLADKAGLPRSSFSQIMGGRLKKINSDIIKKLHEAFPDLSISWLIFGEGNMIVTGEKSSSMEERQPTMEFKDDSEVFPTESQVGCKDAKDFELTEDENEASRPEKTPSDVPQKAVAMEMPQGRHIVKIMVFYDDNTFESFLPE